MNRIGDVVLISLLTVIPGKGWAQNITKRNQLDSIAKPRHIVRKDSVSRMERDVHALGEVVVTAQEARGLSSSSVVGKHAMEHLQPSSFSDLLELLPGGRSVDPTMTQANTIRLREAGSSTNSNYATSSLGTSFVVDGAPISTNANMQFISGGDTKDANRTTMNAGVDLRSISTDDIERVEIIRGIPSVEYGDLTSGLVKIERKRGGRDLSARLKADMDSKLFYLAKGWQWDNGTTLNLSADYLAANGDPRNTLENFKRVNASIRYGRKWKYTSYILDLTSNLDFGSILDNDRQDPDLNKNKIDTYKNDSRRWAWSTVLNLRSIKPSWLKSLSMTFSTSYEDDHSEHTRFVETSANTIAATTLVTGESYAHILPYSYTATAGSEGRPMNVFLKVNGKFQVPSDKLVNTLLIGADWNIDKNFGRGQIFDMLLPLYPGVSARPRDLSTIPANHTISFYAEENVKLPVGDHLIEVNAGVRSNQLFNIGSRYAIEGRMFLDPRVNIGWTMPSFRFFGMPSFIKIYGGVGEHTKFPTLAQLFPDPKYIDLAELNYYNTYHPEYSCVYLQTYVVDETNEELKPARNMKWEMNADWNFGGNRLTVTYFHERMASGFREQRIYAPYAYRKFDAGMIDGRQLTAIPNVSVLPYTNLLELNSNTQYTNGSETLKRGIEYTFASRRIPQLMTRLTITGAWFRTIYRNSMVEMERPSVVLDNRQIQYVGIYKDNDGVTNEMANTNFTFDTDIPRLQLGFSISAQCQWYTSSQRSRLSNAPVAYMNPEGNTIDWKEGDESDTFLHYLVRNYTENDFVKNVVPFAMNLNFKVTKKLFNEKLNVAMFCNRIWDYSPDYQNGNMTIRRHVNPYFGLEMNMKL